MAIVTGNWWAFVVRGIAAIIFGVLTFIMTNMALVTLVFLFGVYALVEGVFNVMAAFRRGPLAGQPWWAFLIEGILSTVAAFIAFFAPGFTILAIVYLIAAWALLTGVVEIVASIRLRRQIKGEWLLAFAGVLSIALGIVLAAYPGLGAVVLVLWVGAYAVVFGVVLIMLGLKLRTCLRPQREWISGTPTIITGH